MCFEKTFSIWLAQKHSMGLVFLPTVTPKNYQNVGKWWYIDHTLSIWLGKLKTSQPFNLPNFRCCFSFKAWKKKVVVWTTQIKLKYAPQINWKSSPKFRVESALKPTVEKISTTFINLAKKSDCKRQVAVVVSSMKPSHHANSGDQALVLRLCNRMLPASPWMEDPSY